MREGLFDSFKRAVGRAFDSEAESSSETKEREDKEFFIGRPVKVLRSSGAVEEGWFVGQYFKESRTVLVATRDGRLTKEVKASDLREWQK